MLLFFYTQISFIHAQPHKNWLNYSYSMGVYSIGIKGDNIWVTTLGGGLVKYNKITGEMAHYNRANANLPENNLLGLFCAENGDIWLGGRNYGIGMYNGENCIIYNEANSGLPSNQINTTIKVDNNGNIWIASFCWMVKYDGNEWKTWITGSDISAWPIISDFDITADGTVWLYSTDGIGKIENDVYTIVSIIGSGLIAKSGYVKVDNEGTVWIAIKNEGLYKYDGLTFTKYDTSNSCLPTNIIYAIDFDSETNMMLATSEGLVSFNTEDCEVFQPLNSDKSLYILKCDENNIIWCGTNNGKFLKFDGSNFSTIDLSNSPLKSNYAYPLFADNENNGWISSTKKTLVTTESGLEQVYNKKVNTGVQDKNGAIWLAFDSGDTCLLKTSGDESFVFDSINSPFNTSKISITHINIDNFNNLWISTNGNGLFKYNGTDFTNYIAENSSLSSNIVFQIACDKDNNLWGGSAQGLFKFDGTNWTTWHTGNSAIPTNVVIELVIGSDNNIWFSCMDENRIVGGEYGGGLIKFDGQVMTTYNMNNSGLLRNTIFDILDDGDKLWLATYGAGLMSFDKTDKWESFNVTNSGIADNHVNGLLKDDKGNIWMGHIDAGISVFCPDSANQTGELDFNKYNYNAGQRIIIYPNPVKNELFVKLNLPNEEIVEASIYDINGKLIQNIPKQNIKNESFLFHFRFQPGLEDNQILILSLKTKNNNIINRKFLYVK